MMGIAISAQVCSKPINAATPSHWSATMNLFSTVSPKLMTSPARQTSLDDAADVHMSLLV